MSSEFSVLVVEDETLVRMDVVDSLIGEGFDVFEAADADAALVLLEGNPGIQMLFTDVDMPGSMDGLTLSAAVHDRWPPIRIVVTSGHRRVAACDMPDGGLFVPKPYFACDLARALHDLAAVPRG